MESVLPLNTSSIALTSRAAEILVRARQPDLPSSDLWEPLLLLSTLAFLLPDITTPCSGLKPQRVMGRRPELTTPLIYGDLVHIIFLVSVGKEGPVLNKAYGHPASPHS